MPYTDPLYAEGMIKLLKSFIDRAVKGEYSTALVRNDERQVIDLREPPAHWNSGQIVSFVNDKIFTITVIPKGEAQARPTQPPQVGD
jgi:hypothetical protein